MQLIRSCLLTLALACAVSGYPQYQQAIPNGANVMDPSDPTVPWPGVGHVTHAGGGMRNAFGEAFAANGYEWTGALCREDSDGDGRSNGEELGDKDCTWTPGTEPEGNATSHPGICEPLDSEHCQHLNQLHHIHIQENFHCPPAKEEGVLVSEMRFPVTEVPAEETNFFCNYFSLGAVTENQHVIAFEVILDNIDVVHSMVAYGCRGDRGASLLGQHPQSCREVKSECVEVLMIWGFGAGGGFCYGEDYGGLIGPQGFTGIWLAMAWKNPFEQSGLTDSSGFRIYHTPKLRPNPAAFILWGPKQFHLPAGEEEVSATGTCDRERTSELSGPKYISLMAAHMQVLGRRMTVVQSRPGEFEHVILDEQNFDFTDLPVTIFEKPDYIEILPGDELRVTCTWNTEGESGETVWGAGTNDEMCFFVALLHPFDQTVPVLCGQEGGGAVTEEEKDDEEEEEGSSPEGGSSGARGGVTGMGVVVMVTLAAALKML